MRCRAVSDNDLSHKKDYYEKHRRIEHWGEAEVRIFYQGNDVANGQDTVIGAAQQNGLRKITNSVIISLRVDQAHLVFGFQ